MITYHEVVNADMQRVIDEMVELISGKYPGTTYILDRGEEWEQYFLYADLDVDDTDEVVDLYMDRLVTIHVDEGIRLHVIPRRTQERLRAASERQLLERRQSA